MDPADDAQLLAGLATTMHDEPGESATVDAIFEQAAQLLPAADHVSITLRARRGTFRSPGWTSDVAAEADRLQLALGEGPCVDVSSEPGWVHSADVTADDRWPRWGPEAGELGLRSLLSVQVLDRAKPYGAINIYSDAVGAFADPEDLHLALLWATHAAAALASAQTADGLTTAIAARHAIGVAQGVVMAAYDVDESAAFALLVRLASSREEKVSVIARRIARTREVPQDGR